MEPVDQRITAAHLVSLRLEPGAAVAIAQALGVNRMPPNLAARTRRDIDEFLASGDATLASQLIHAALVRNNGHAATPSALDASGAASKRNDV